MDNVDRAYVEVADGISVDGVLGVAGCRWESAVHSCQLTEGFQHNRSQRRKAL